jgi:hypothetical protein
MDKSSKRCLIVVATLAVGIGVSVLVTHRSRATAEKLHEQLEQHKQVTHDLRYLRNAIGAYKDANGVYPRAQQRLATDLITAGQAAKPSELDRAWPTDPWGSAYVYVCPGKIRPDDYDLFSAGPDRTPDTVDDDWGD